MNLSISRGRELFLRLPPQLSFRLLPLLFLGAFGLTAGHAQALPTGFVFLDEAAPEVRTEARYAGENNFMGAPVDGYRSGRLALSAPAAAALRKAAAMLAPFGLGLKVFDAYRPQRAVDHFARWAADLEDTRNQASYYPREPKAHLFRDGYIARKSGHSRGSTVDLTVVNLDDGSELAMGTHFDFFGPESWHEYRALDATARANRALLQQVMIRAGFRPLKEEWWHFTLDKEPWPTRYFDFLAE